MTDVSNVPNADQAYDEAYYAEYGNEADTGFGSSALAPGQTSAIAGTNTAANRASLASAATALNTAVQTGQDISPATTGSTIPGGLVIGQQTNTGTTTTEGQVYSDATTQIAAALSSLGLGAMSNWATSVAYALSGQGMSASDIISTIEAGLNNPIDPGTNQVDQAALAAFNAALPGFNQRITLTGNNGSPGASPVQAIAAYIQYQTQLQQFATQAGLAPGTLSAQVGGNLWAYDVSSAEVSQRITDATVSASSAPQQVQDYLAQNFPGMSGTAALASYYLNPTNTMQTITQNLNTATVGGEAAITGFDKSMSVANAQALGAFLANGASGANAGQVGQIGQVTAGQANNVFTTNLGGGIQGSAAQLAGLESITPGQNAGSTATENQLLSAIGVPGEGSTQAQALLGISNAQQTRTASARGGGGATTTSNGAVGLGYAES